MTGFRKGLLAGFPLLLLTAVVAYGAGERGKLSGSYFVYGGSLGDSGPATAKDAKVWMEVSGPLASQMYERLGRGAQLKDGCSAGTRKRGAVSCSLDGTADPVCHVNMDLRTGKVWGGTIC